MKGEIKDAGDRDRDKSAHNSPARMLNGPGDKMKEITWKDNKDDEIEKMIDKEKK